MKKRLSLVLGTLTLVVGSAYFLTGKLIQQNYYESIAKLNNPGKIQVNLLSYTRGVIHSTAKLELTLPGKTPAQTYTFALEQKITHGPLVAVRTLQGFRIKFVASEIKTTLEKTFAKKLEEALGTSEPFRVITIVKFDNSATTWFNIAAVNQVSPSQLNVMWQPIQGEIEHDLNFAAYNGNINLSQFSLKNESVELNIQNMKLALGSQQQDKNIKYSNALSAEQLNFSKNGTAQLQLKDLAFNLDLTEHDATTLTLLLTAGVAESQIMQQKFTQDSAKLEITNLPVETLPSATMITSMGTRETMDFLQRLTLATKANFTLELPKYFSESLISYISYELYKTSVIGKADIRSDNAIFDDVSSSINGIVQGALRQKLFVDQGTYYALNFAATLPPPQAAASDVQSKHG